MAVTATFDAGTLTELGDSLDNTIVTSRNAAARSSSRNARAHHWPRKAIPFGLALAACGWSAVLRCRGGGRP